MTIDIGYVDPAEYEPPHPVDPPEVHADEGDHQADAAEYDDTPPWDWDDEYERAVW